MQRILYVCAIVALSSGLSHIGTHLKTTVSHQKFHHFLQKHSNSSVHTCPQIQQEMQNASHKMEECIHKKLRPEFQNACHFFAHDFKLCAKSPKELLVRCLPKESEDVPDLIIDMILSLMNYTCNAKGSEIFELALPCVTHSLTDVNDSACSEELALKLMDYSNKFPTRAEVCECLGILRSCLQSYLTLQCSSSVTVKNFLNFYDAMAKPCKK